MFGNIDHADALLLNGADVNIQEGKCGKCPIHMSIERRDVVITRRLLAEVRIFPLVLFNDRSET